MEIAPALIEARGLFQGLIADRGYDSNVIGNDEPATNYLSATLIAASTGFWRD